MFLTSDVKEHMIQTHGSYFGRMHGPPRPYQCQNCNGTFKTQSALGLHLCYDTYIPKKKTEEPYKCDKCDKSYSRNYLPIDPLGTHLIRMIDEIKLCELKFWKFSIMFWQFIATDTTIL